MVIQCYKRLSFRFIFFRIKSCKSLPTSSLCIRHDNVTLLVNMIEYCRNILNQHYRKQKCSKWWSVLTLLNYWLDYWDQRGCDRMVVGFTTTYAISAYHHWCCEFEFRSGRAVQHYMIKCVNNSDRSVVFSRSSGFLHQ